VTALGTRSETEHIVVWNESRPRDIMPIDRGGPAMFGVANETRGETRWIIPVLRHDSGGSGADTTDSALRSVVRERHGLDLGELVGDRRPDKLQFCLAERPCLQLWPVRTDVQ
jgi:hypothetical protein